MLETRLEASRRVARAMQRGLVKLVFFALLSSPIHIRVVSVDMSYTLFQSLTRLENQVFPATESIKQLIQTIARDVVRFRRNTQISYHFVARATRVCDEINDLIRRVDETDDWDSYDKFTEAIDLLEECVGPFPRSLPAKNFGSLLLESTVTVQDEVQRHFGGEKDIDGYIASAANWANNRKRLRSFLTGLSPKSEIGVSICPVTPCY